MILIARRRALAADLQSVLRLLVRAEPYLLPFVAIAPLFLPNPYRPFAAVVAVIFALLRWPMLGHIIRRTPLDWPIGLTVIGAIIGTVVSPDRAVSTELLWGYLGAVALFYLIATRRSDANLRSYMVWLVGIPLLLAGVIWGVSWAKDGSSLSALLQTIGGREQVPGLFSRPFPHENLIGGQWTYQQIGRLLPAVSSWQTSANDVVGFYAIAYPFLLSGGLRGRRATRLLWLLLALALAAVLALTGSRAGLLALAAGSLGVLAAHWRKPWLSVWMLSLPLALLALAWLGLQSVPWIGIADTSGLDRIGMWHASLYMLQDFPLTGVGLGAWPIVYNLLYLGDPSVANPHNLLLETYLDLGPLGLIGLLWFIVCGLRAGFGPVTEDSWTCSWIRHGLAGAWLAFIILGSFETLSVAEWHDGNAYHAVISPIPWILAALSVVLRDSSTATFRSKTSSSSRSISIR